MSADQFDIELKSWKFHRKNCWVRRQILKCSMHPVAPGWSNQYWNWFTAEIKRVMLPGLKSHKHQWHLCTNNCSSRFGSQWMELVSKELSSLSQLESFCFRAPNPYLSKWNPNSTEASEERMCGCVCVCAYFCVCVRRKANLRNGTRLGHWPIYIAWRIITFFWHWKNWLTPGLYLGRGWWILQSGFW